MRLTRPMLAVAGATAALALAACGADTKAATVPAEASGSLESLAAKVKCTPDLQTDADELRQAICKMSYGKFVLATFATDRGQREWINDAKDYGGFYLVGRKWVVVGTDKIVKKLQTTLGGNEEIGTDHSKHTS